MASNQLSGSLDLLLLSVLSERDAHGYAVITRLKEVSDGAFDLPEGTVYPALHRLEAEGLLVSRWDSESGRRRRCYALSPRGRAAQRARRREWTAYRSGVESVLAVAR